MPSELVFYSIGIAAENKGLTSRELMVSPTELNPTADGEITFNPTERVFSGVDRNGEEYSVTATEDNALPAEWLPMGSNRVTPPDIRRGEPIALYRLGDTARYYWRCMGLRDDLRRLETVIYAFNGTPDNNSQELNLDNCYFFEVSTHNRTITMGTSQKNNEAVKYAAQFDAGNGKFTVEDNLGNFMHLDSTNVLWELHNADGTKCRLDRKNIFLDAPDSIYASAKNLIRMSAQNIQLLAGSGIELKAGNSIYAEAPDITAKASQVTLDTPQTTMTGNASTGGNMKVGGSISTGTGGGGGNATIGGSADIQGSLNCGEITCTRVNSSGPVNGSNI